MSAERPLRARASRARLADLRALTGAGPILVLAPHPDDEAFGCGGLIALARRAGIRVRVAFVTDGAASHPGSASWPPSRIACRRRLEAVRAARALDLRPSDLAFLGLPDGEAAFDLDRLHALAAPLARWARRARATALFATWSGEPHPDHVGAAELANAIRLRAPRLLLRSYPIWSLFEPHATAPAALPLRRLDVRAARAAKAAAIAAHRSQVTRMIFDGDDPSPPAPPRRPFLAGAELFILERRSRASALETRGDLAAEALAVGWAQHGDQFAAGLAIDGATV